MRLRRLRSRVHKRRARGVAVGIGPGRVVGRGHPQRWRRSWRSGWRPTVGSQSHVLVTDGEGETVETPCVACRCVVLRDLQRCVLLATYGGPPATPPGPLPPPRVTSPDYPTRPYPHRHTENLAPGESMYGSRSRVKAE